MEPTEVSRPPGRLAGKRKRTVLFCIWIALSTVAMLAAVLFVDLYLHHRHGVNFWGYRGPVAARKEPGEKRIVVLGGSVVWGYGLPWNQAFPAQLLQKLEAMRGADGIGRVSVLNLGFNSEGAHAFKYNLQDYDYLDYDVVMLYSGYNDLIDPNLAVYRHESPTFRATGYMPLLPSVLQARMAMLRARFDKNKRQVVFVPPPRQPGTDGSDAAQQGVKSLEQQLGSLTSAQGTVPGSGKDCTDVWAFYCQQMYEAVSFALARGKRVIVVTEPYISDRHVGQQQCLVNMLQERFAGRSDLYYVNLGRTVDLRDPALCWDGVHLTDEGNRRIAEALVQPVLEVLKPR